MGTAFDECGEGGRVAKCRYCLEPKYERERLLLEELGTAGKVTELNSDELHLAKKLEKADLVFLVRDGTSGAVITPRGRRLVAELEQKSKTRPATIPLHLARLYGLDGVQGRGTPSEQNQSLQKSGKANRTKVFRAVPCASFPPSLVIARAGLEQGLAWKTFYST